MLPLARHACNPMLPAIEKSPEPHIQNTNRVIDSKGRQGADLAIGPMTLGGRFPDDRGHNP
jgi:hypothetical protein